CFFLAGLAVFAKVLSLLPLVVEEVVVLSDPIYFFLTLAFVFRGSAPEAMTYYSLWDSEFLMSSFVNSFGKMTPYSCVHEEVDDDLGEARVVHLITLFDILVLYLINEIFPQKVGIVYDKCRIHISIYA
ncbi:hypothetical protein Tco_0279258, partial [Tanacetum coccineum]